MDLEVVRQLAQALMRQHGLADWSLRFDHARRRAGSCRADSRTITLSRHLMVLYSEDQVRETVLHEIAHALAGPQHGHNAVWRSIALRIGSSGERLVASDAPRLPAPWQGICPAGHIHERHRRPARPASCTQCSRRFNPNFLITWTRNGRAEQMSPAYERELAVLRRLAGTRP